MKPPGKIGVQTPISQSYTLLLKTQDLFEKPAHFANLAPGNYRITTGLQAALKKRDNVITSRFFQLHPDPPATRGGCASGSSK
jgi:hypothetical protein